jgi:signal transduction histidine kinase
VSTVPATVLVVEDDRLLLEGLGEALETRGYVAVCADGASKALEALSQLTPDVIVSDIVMPGMDGYALLDEVRSLPRLATVPFIFLSARDERDAVRAGMAHGADDYVTKPFRTEELLEAIESRLRRLHSIEDARAAERDDWVHTLATTLHHELRTPLAEMSASAELLATAEGELDESELDSIVRGVFAGVERLHGVVADLLLLSDLRTGRAFEDHSQRAAAIDDLARLLVDVVAGFEGDAERAGVALHLEVPDALPEVVGDRPRLADAVGRLVDNAVKFSPRGGHVQVEARGSETSVEIAVADEGIGFDPASWDEMLQPLQQIQRPRLEQQGVGNGLAICKGVVELHGGRLSAGGRPGGGSIFSIRLPARTP